MRNDWVVPIDIYAYVPSCRLQPELARFARKILVARRKMGFLSVPSGLDDSDDLARETSETRKTTRIASPDAHIVDTMEIVCV